MFYDRPLPFHTIYPEGMLVAAGEDADREWDKMKEYYPEQALRIMECVESVCDRYEYDGSMLYDECPDRMVMQKLCREVRERVRRPDRGGRRSSCCGEGVDDLISVLLTGEMYRRRCKKCCHNRHF